MNRKLKKTNQRVLILKYLRSVNTHPTAEKVYEEVRKNLPQISLATVYRNLKTLNEAGEIFEIETQGASRFDGDLRPHQHLICEKCGIVKDVFLDNLTQKTLKLFRSNREFSVRTVKIDFYGLCKKCKREVIK